MQRLILAVLACCVCGGVVPAQESSGIKWSKSLDAALSEAKATGKPVFIAFNMDKERANDAMAKRHYRDKEVVALAQRFVPVICSKYRHTDDESVCPRFGAVTCSDHIKCELASRQRYLGTDRVDAPQHLFLKPDGTLFRRKVWFMSVSELRKLMTDVLIELAPKANRDLLGEPAEGAAEGKGESKEAASDGAPAKKADEVDPESPEGLRRTILGTKDAVVIRDAARKLLLHEDPEAVKWVEETALDPKQGERRRGLALALGIKNRKESVPILLKLLEDEDPELRNHAAVALECVAHKSAVKGLKKRFAKEQTERVRKNLVRALGTCGKGKSGVAAILVKATRDKSALVQRNAMIALGDFPRDAKAEKALIVAAFRSGGRGGGGRGGGRGGRGGGGGGGRGSSFEERIQRVQAALYGLAKMKSKEALKETKKRLQRERNPQFRELLNNVLEVLEGDADIEEYEAAMARVAGDVIERDDGSDLLVKKKADGEAAKTGDGRR